MQAERSQANQWVLILADLFEAEFRVTFADGSIETFPNAGFIPVRINEDVS